MGCSAIPTNGAILVRLDPGMQDPGKSTSVARNNQSLCILKLTVSDVNCKDKRPDTLRRREGRDFSF